MRSSHLVACAALTALVTTSAAAQCQSWRGGFGISGTNGVVSALRTFDDGSGPAIFAGGSFTAAGDARASRIVRWDGAEWSRLGELNGDVLALAPWNAGSNALWVAGSFTTIDGAPSTRIGAWTGSGWITVPGGPSHSVRALQAFDDGSGSKLYVGGDFTSTAGLPADRIARFDGIAWSTIGAGANGSVRAFAVHDDGSGPALYAAGNFTTMDGVAANRIARWNGAAWSPLGSGLNSEVRALTVHDFGAGPRLVAGGNFSLAGGVSVACVAAWDGTSWASIGSGTNWFVNTFAAYDDGSGLALYAGGEFTFPGFRISRFDGASWQPVGAGVNNFVNALAQFDAGSGRQLYLGGTFTVAGGAPALRLATFDDSGFAAVERQWGLDNFVQGFESYDEGAGRKLFVCGSFANAGPVPASIVARWDGAAFSALPGGPNAAPIDMEEYDDGSGAQLYVGGGFNSLPAGVPAFGIARWNGSAWSNLGAGVAAGTRVNTLAKFDDGSGTGLYLGGNFTSAGGISALRVVRYDGAGWSALGSGLGGECTALRVFDDGSGAALYAVGAFSTAGGIGAQNIARWDGATWSALGEGITGSPRCLAVFDDGSGPALFVGGDFTLAGTTAAIDIARWDGSTWSALPPLVNASSVSSLAMFDDGTGPALYAGCANASSVGVFTLSLQRLDGGAWTVLDGGLGGLGSPVIDDLFVHDDGSGPGPTLWVGGRFNVAGDRYSTFIAGWQGCAGAGEPFCFGDGTGSACPCANASAIGARDGCVNSTGQAGRLRASGAASISADTLSLLGSQMTNGTALYFQGTQRSSGGAGIAFGDGLRCAGGTVVRLDITFNVGGASVDPQFGDPPVSVQGSVSAPGTRVYQVWFRDAVSFCTPSTFNLTNGLQVSWTM